MNYIPKTGNKHFLKGDPWGVLLCCGPDVTYLLSILILFPLFLISFSISSGHWLVEAMAQISCIIFYIMDLPVFPPLNTLN